MRRARQPGPEDGQAVRRSQPHGMVTVAQQADEERLHRRQRRLRVGVRFDPIQALGTHKTGFNRL